MSASTVSLFVSGDVMTGRGIDQILAHPSQPVLFESYVKSALQYVELAERVSGPIPRKARPEYIWGCALAELERARPDARIVNLETAVTTSATAEPGKDIHYRMHPANIACLSAARIDCCVLANNHVLDWGRPGLEETLRTVRAAGMLTTGAGADEDEAAAPAELHAAGTRLLVHGFALPSSGVPRAWRATPRHPGVNWVADLSSNEVERIGQRIARERLPGDLVMASIHWGGNWGYEISSREREFAHGLIDRAGVDLVHGHSSHHPRGIEVYHRKLILYGCGDLLNDYEGIGGYETFRPELALLYFPKLDAAHGNLLDLTLIPLRMSRFQLTRASEQESAWLAATLDRECRKLRGRVIRSREHLSLQWD